MTYIISWIGNYILFSAGKISRQRHLFALISICALGALVVLRGRVGVDTSGIYESMAMWSVFGLKTEPLFALLLYIMSALFPTPLLAITMGIGSIYVLLLLVYVARADLKELYVFNVFFVPVLFWKMGINELRYGIALAFVLLAMQSFKRQQKLACILLITSAVITHYSSFLFLMFWVILAIPINPKLYLKFGLPILSAAVIVLLMDQDYLYTKYVFYSGNINHNIRSYYTGIGPAMILTLQNVGVCLGNLDRSDKVRIVAVSVLMISSSYFIMLSTDAGLRFLEMSVIATTYAALYVHQNQEKEMGFWFCGAVGLSGLIGMTATYHNMLIEKNVLFNLQSPSIPYRFFWQ